MKLPWFGRARGPAPISIEATYRPVAHVVSVAEGDRTVLLDPERGEYYGLDEVGTRIWSLLQDGSTVAAVVDVLEGEYDATRERLEADCVALLTRLSQLGVVAAA